MKRRRGFLLDADDTLFDHDADRRAAAGTARMVIFAGGVYP
jgi:hypothetical protein